MAMHPYNMARANRDRASVAPVNGKPIVWTDDERRAVAREAFRIASERSITQTRAVLQAQQILPVHRQRPASFAKSADLGWLRPLWDEMKSDAAKKGAQALFEPAKAEPVANTVAVPASVPASVPEPATTESKPNQETADAAPSSSEPSSSARRGDAGKTKIFWRDDEKRALAAKMREYLQRYPDMSKIEALRKAQGVVLKPERQREGLTGWTFVADWADPMLAQLEIDEQLAALQAKEAREANERAEAERKAREAAEAEARAAAAREQEAKFESVVQARFDAMGFDDLIRGFARKMAREVIDAMGEEFERALSNKIGAMLPGVQQQADKPVPLPKDRAPVIGVAGLWGRQETENAQAAFEGKVKFVFVGNQEHNGNGAAGPGIKEKFRACDLVIVMADHVGHDSQSAIKKLGVPYKFVSGSTSSLKRFVAGWLHSEGK